MNPATTLKRHVYDTHEEIPDDHRIGYQDELIPVCVITDDQHNFHSLLVRLTQMNEGRIPHALLQRYGLNPITTYCQIDHNKQPITHLCTVMRRAVVSMMEDLHANKQPLPPWLDAA